MKPDRPKLWSALVRKAPTFLARERSRLVCRAGETVTHGASATRLTKKTGYIAHESEHSLSEAPSSLRRAQAARS